MEKGWGEDACILRWTPIPLRKFRCEEPARGRMSRRCARHDKYTRTFVCAHNLKGNGAGKQHFVVVDEATAIRGCDGDAGDDDDDNACCRHVLHATAAHSSTLAHKLHTTRANIYGECTYACCYSNWSTL